MDEHQVLGDGWKTIASDPTAVHEALDISDKIFVCFVCLLSHDSPP